MRHWLVGALSVVIVIAACGPKSTPSQPTAGGSCPDVDAMYAVQWSDGFGGSTYGAPEGSHWQLPLGYKTVADGAAPGPLSPEQLTAWGLRPAPETLWIYNNNAEPTTGCKATRVATAGYYLNDGPLEHVAAYASYQGCKWPADRYGYTGAVAGASAPAGCGFVHGTMRGSYVGADGESYQMPPAPVKPPPADIAGVLRQPSAEACTGCTLLWSDERTATTPELIEVTATWLKPDPNESSCNWTAENDFGVFVAAPTGPQRVELDTSFSLAGAFVSGGALVAAMVYDVGEVGIWPYADGKLRASPLFESYVNHEEDFIPRSHGPYCGP